MNNELKCCGCGRETIDRVKQCGCTTMAGRAEGAKGTEWMERIPARTHGMVLARIDPPNAAQPVFAIRQDQLDYLANSLTAALAALGEAREALDDANARLAPYLNNVLTSDELKLVDKHCDWPSFKCAFNAVMNSRKARATLAKLNALEGETDE